MSFSTRVLTRKGEGMRAGAQEEPLRHPLAFDRSRVIPRKRAPLETERKSAFATEDRCKAVDSSGAYFSANDVAGLDRILAFYRSSQFITSTAAVPIAACLKKCCSTT